MPQARWYQAQVTAGRAPPLQPGAALVMEATVRPSAAELQANSRSRSAVLHIMKRVEAPTVAELERRLYPLLQWPLPEGAGGHGEGVGGALGEACPAKKGHRPKGVAKGARGGGAGSGGGISKKEEREQRRARKEKKMKKAAKKAKKGLSS